MNPICRKSSRHTEEVEGAVGVGSIEPFRFINYYYLLPIKHQKLLILPVMQNISKSKRLLMFFNSFYVVKLFDPLK
jgi:hypothetical protein